MLGVTADNSKKMGAEGAEAIRDSWRRITRLEASNGSIAMRSSSTDRHRGMA